MKKAQPRVRRDALVACPDAAMMRRFLACVTEQDDGCWLFSKTSSYGYGIFFVKRIAVAAHRCTLLWTKPRKDSQYWMACHTCRNRNCVAPHHLYWGTAKTNRLDAMRDGTAYNPGIWGEGNPSAKLTEAQVLDIYASVAEGRSSVKESAAAHGVCEGAILAILKRRRWSQATRGLAPVDLVQREHARRRGSGNGRALMNEETVTSLWMEYRAGGTTARQLALKYGYSYSSVAQVISRGNWRSVTDLLPPIPEGVGAKNRNAAAMKTVSKVREIDVVEIRYSLSRGEEGQAIAARFNVSLSIILNIAKGKTWKHVSHVGLAQPIPLLESP